jgi:hypothetical protein
MRIVTQKRGIRTNPARRVPMILQTVPILPIAPTTHQLVCISVRRIFVTIGESIHNKKLVGANNTRAIILEENLIS